WLIPTIFRPSGVVTSPAPTVAKQTRRPSGPQAIAPSWTTAGATPRSARARCHARPTQWAARPTSSSHSGSPAGRTTSTHAVVAGSTNTAPPPERRRTTATPARAAAPASTRSSRWVEPSTSAGAVASSTHTARCGASGTGSAWSSPAVPRNRRSAQPPGSAVTAGRAPPPRRSGGELQVGRTRLGDRADGEGEPAGAGRLGRRAQQPHRGLHEQPVRLAHVARAAGSDDVVPRVTAAAAAGHDVVDALGWGAAVLAAVAVPGEDGPTVERR